MVQSFSGARAALEEVFHYYKVGRHGEDSLEEPYSLLSRCTQIVSSLWLADQASDGGFFQAASPPLAFQLAPDFGERRHTKDEKQAIDGDWSEERLTKDTRWFEFWMRLLGQLDSSSARAYQEFSQRILACVKRPDFLEGTAGRRNREVLRLFTKGDETGRVMVRTMSVLEDFTRAIVGYFTTPEARRCALEQTIVLTGLLREIRRIIIWETPTAGPYMPGSDTRWRARSPWQWLFRDRTRGTLMMVPRREGGQIVCTFHPAPDSRGRITSWERSVTALKGTYEEELFATWSYGSGEHRDHPDQFPDLEACWTVQNAEAGRLEILSREIDSLLDVLRRHPRCGGLVETVRRISRNDTPRWKARTLPWAYLRDLDQLLSQLVVVCDEAQARQGDDVTSIIDRLWPSGEATTERRELDNRPGRRAEKAPAASVSPNGACAPGRVASTPSRPVPCAQDQPPQAAETPEPFLAQPIAQEWEPSPSVPATEPTMSSPTESTSGTLASLMQRLRSEQTGDEKNTEGKPQDHAALPDAADVTVGSERADLGEAADVVADPEQTHVAEVSGVIVDSERVYLAEGSDIAADPERPHCAVGTTYASPLQPVEANAGGVVAGPQKQSDPGPALAMGMPDKPPPDGIDDDLLRRLLEYHRGLEKTSQHQPRSCGELQLDLSWSQSRLQRAMTNIFGPKPFSVYRSKCKDCTICAYLKALPRGNATSKSRGSRDSAAPCPEAGAAQRGRQGSRRCRRTTLGQA